MTPPDPIEAQILALTAACGPARSISPSDVAHALHTGENPDGWQRLLTPVRQAAIRLARAGQIDILRKGKPVPLDEVRGVIRLRTRPPETQAP